jgi:outer membrane protein assembly factor BamB
MAKRNSILRSPPFLALSLSLCLSGGLSAISAQERSLGTPITSVTIPASAQGSAPAGRNFAYVVANGNPAVFQVLDVPSGELAYSRALPGAHASWGMVVTPDQAVYFGTQRNGQLFRWRPGQAEPENLSGPNLIGETHIWRLAADEEGVVYGGTYPNGKVFSYNPATGEIRDYGPAKEGVMYVRSTTVAGDYIYAGTSPEPHIIEIHKESGEKREIPLPPAYASSADSVYDLTAADGFLFARFPPSSDVGVFSLAKREWVKTIASTPGLEVSPPGPDGRIYLGQNGRLIAYNPSSNEVESTGSPMPFGARSFRWIDLGLEEYPGKTLVSVGMRGDLFFYNPATGHNQTRPSEAEGVPIVIRALEQGPDGNVYVGGYLAPQEMAVFDPDAGEIVKLPGTAQVEAMHVHEGKLYIGRYPNASVLVFDPARPWNFGQNPETVLQLSTHQQDRPFGFASAGNQVAIGTVPRSGRLGGVLAFYDPASGQTAVHEQVVRDQGIVALTYRDGFVYGGTTIWGGLGIAPATDEALLFIWDVAAGEKVWQQAPVPGEKAITALTFDGEGQLWGLTAGKLFRFDPSHRRVEMIRELFPFDWPGTYWQSGFLEFDAEDGKFYGTTVRRLFSFDPRNETLDILAENAAYFARDRHGNFYFARGTELMTIPRPASEQN